MKLYDLLHYRDMCPICKDAPLATFFHSARRQQIKMEEDRLVVIFCLDSLKKKHIDYKVGYSFGLKDDSFRTEFYTKDDKRFENDTPRFLMDRFKTLNNNLKGYRFYRECVICRRYNYTSSRFDINLKGATVQNLYIKQESVSLDYEYKGDLKIFRLDNNLETQHSDLSCWNTTNPLDRGLENSIPHEAMFMHLPLIPFVSKEETTERLKNLLTFY